MERKLGETFDLEGNVYKDKQSNKVWFNLFKAI